MAPTAIMPTIAQGKAFPPALPFDFADDLRRRPRVAVLAICPNPVRVGLSPLNPFRKVGVKAKIDTSVMPNRTFL
jgi:hypothetical protein